jgi:hypothetical protein
MSLAAEAEPMSMVQAQNRKGLNLSRGIRPCERRDFEQITKLYRQILLTRGQPHDHGLTSFLKQIYLDNPWANEKCPSLVFEEGGMVKGFLGVIPRKMKFHGDPITVAVSSSLMVEADQSGKRNPIAGINLLRCFLAGEQDLSITDTANDITRALWTSSGGSTAYPYCYAWTRPLKPLHTCLELGVSSPLIRGMATPVVRASDWLLRNLPSLKPDRPGCQVKDIDTAGLLALSKALPRQAIMPDYDLDSLEWLIMMAEQSESEGTLAKREVQTTDGRTLGWYVYYRNRNGIGRVLQLAALPRSMDVVLDCLIYEASQEGLAALMGRAEPHGASLLNDRHCFFRGRSWFLVHSPEPEIIHAFQNADAFFSGFDGEHWMRVNA